MRSRGTLGALLAALALGVALLVVLLRPLDAEPVGPAAVDRDSGLPMVALATLPVEARATVALVDQGGPFPYAKDGAVFGNRERLLPARPNGFYREYTVPTPGQVDRGPRRIVTGDHGDQVFYSPDHYASFVRVSR